MKLGRQHIAIRLICTMSLMIGLVGCGDGTETSVDQNLSPAAVNDKRAASATEVAPVPSHTGCRCICDDGGFFDDEEAYEWTNDDGSSITDKDTCEDHGEHMYLCEQSDGELGNITSCIIVEYTK